MFINEAINNFNNSEKKLKVYLKLRPCFTFTIFYNFKKGIRLLKVIHDLTVSQVIFIMGV